MYNRLYKCLAKNSILYEKQFGFQKNHSTDHAITTLIDELASAFDKDLYTLGVFIDLSKAFDTVNHNILVSKLNHYGIKNNNLKWLSDYLSNRKQCVTIDDELSNLEKINCGVPQGSILGPLLFLIYINDIYNATDYLRAILFADDTNLFYSHKDVNILYNICNQELSGINEWFKANKLSLNVTKTKYTLFHKPSRSENLPLKLPRLLINNTHIQRKNQLNSLA